MFLRLKNFIYHLPELKQLLVTTGATNGHFSEEFGRFHTSARSGQKEGRNSEEDRITGSLASKYDVFVPESASEVFDVEEEREKFYEINDETEQQERSRKAMVGISLERGTTGVIDLEELVAILKRENAIDTVVIKIPENMCYADYMIITSAKSHRHMNAIAEFVRTVFKRRMEDTDFLPRLEGSNSKRWKALDLQNIVLHIISEPARRHFDLETLWAVGRKYDTLYNEQKSSEIDYVTVLSNLTPPESK